MPSTPPGVDELDVTVGTWAGTFSAVTLLVFTSAAGSDVDALAPALELGEELEVICKQAKRVNVCTWLQPGL